VPVVDRAARSCSLWSDLRLVGALRSRPPGVLIGTRSGLNMVVAEVAPPGFVKVGQEHLNFEVKSAELKHAIRRRFRGLDLLLVLTQTDLARYARALGDSVSVERMPNAVPRGGPPKTTRKGTTILAAGRLTRQKGFDRLVPAFGRVVERHPDWKLRLCGAGAERERLEQMVADHGLSEHVSLPGAVPLEGEMAAASMFVLSSRFEGFPMVLLEAMGHGLPVVSFDCPTGPREVIEPRVNGLLAPPDSVQALATAMLEMIEDEPLRRRCAEGALETARDYSLDAIGPRWDALIARLTRESGTVGSPPCSPR
ncbi:MAG: hypothetical protein QOJ57_2190, partial [Thermoleophilaceae bacterium]|nr:hypothetical protein [Thermoleophilaceae bacterium]